MKAPTAVGVPIARIRLDGGTQPRAALDFDAIEDYAEAMAAGARFPSVVVFHDGENYWLADGFHRLKAAYAAGFDVIGCEVRQGTLEDARWHSFSANKSNGLRRTRGDIEGAIRSALTHPKSALMSDRAIARHVGCSHSWVSELRRASVRQRTDADTRTVTRRGRTYRQRTGNIGRRQSRPPAASHAPEPPPTDAGQVPNRDAPGQEMLDALLRAAQTIAGCGIAARDLARQVSSRADRDHILALMEQTSEFLELCATEARRVEGPPASDERADGSCLRAHSHAGDAADRRAVA